MRTNADLVVETLQAAGIICGFGVPSGNTLPLMEAMRARGMGFVLTAHEGSAGFAADVMGRLTRRPGLCIATLGPGATNLATGVGCAYLDRSPMIAITCTLPEAQRGRRLQMAIDHHALFAPIAKASLTLREGAAAATLADALTLAMSEPVGPVHLDLPEDVAVAPTREDAPPPPTPRALPPPQEPDLEAATALIARAERPVAVIGASATRMRDTGLLRRCVEANAMPFATTTMAKGLIDDDHPLALGCIERARRQVQRAFLARADLIVGIGYDSVEVEYEAWIGGTSLLHVDIAPADIDGTVRLAGTVVGDLDVSVASLCAAGPVGPRWDASALAAHRRDFQASLRPKMPGFVPHEAIDRVSAALPRDGILAFDVGAHTHQIASQWTAHTNDGFLITNGWSSMGFGLPAAIAAKIARPDRKVVSLIGDGCFQMSCGELVAAQRLGLALPVVVLVDRSLSLIRVKQEKRQYPEIGTVLSNAPYAGPPSHYFGVPAVGASDGDALEEAIGNAFAADGPTVIEALVDPRHYAETVFD